MTIALGILTPEGAVLAADTLESWAVGYRKTQVPKILIGSTDGASGCGCIGVAGAGDSEYLACIKQEIVNGFLDECRSANAAGLLAQMKASVARFHRDHVIPLSPVPDRRPSLELVVAMCHSGNARLLVTNRSAVRDAAPWVAVGAGANYVNALFGGLPGPWPTMELAKILAAYGVFCAKKTEGCGGETQLASIMEDRAQYEKRDILSRMEALFSSYEGIESRVFRYSIGCHSLDSQAELSTLTEWHSSLRRDFEKLAEEM
jgi:hypothetical protein